MSYPICPICGREMGGWDVPAGTCMSCYGAYQQFCGHMPPNWKKLTRGNHPGYERWKEEQLIKKALREGLITQEEAERQAAELAREVYKDWNETSEEVRQRLAVQKAMLQTTDVREAPSILPDWPPKK